MDDAVRTKLEIGDQLYRYCRGLDRMDKALARSVFHPDARVVYDGIFEGSGFRFLDWVWPGHADLVRHSHHLTNIYVEPDEGRAPRSEAYVMVLLRRAVEGGVRTLFASGRYLDRWGRHEGRWVIVQRHYVPEFLETPGAIADAVPAHLTSSRRDLGDPSFGLFAAAGAMIDEPGGGRFAWSFDPAGAGSKSPAQA